MVTQRRNEQWIEALRQRGPETEAATGELRSFLLRGMGRALSGRLPQDALEDLVQDALMQILSRLDAFEGRSKFTTWAMSVAIHSALGELRRAHWKNLSLEQLALDGSFDPDVTIDSNLAPEKRLCQEMVLATLHRCIMEKLTEKQRQALLALLNEVPLEEVSRRTGGSRNRVYKLLYDARKKLKEQLIAAGFSDRFIWTTFDL